MNMKMNRDEYTKGMRWTVKTVEGTNKVVKMQFDTETPLGDQTMDSTFIGFQSNYY